jgi:hypothetical protein
MQEVAPMNRNVLVSLTVMSLVLIAVPAGAQQPAPPRTPPAQQVLPEDCPKFVTEITRLTNVRFDPTAAEAKQAAARATALQAEGKYAECLATARPALASVGLVR